jgi:hypothetical protein
VEGLLSAGDLGLLDHQTLAGRVEDDPVMFGGACIDLVHLQIAREDALVPSDLPALAVGKPREVCVVAEEVDGHCA